MAAKQGAPSAEAKAIEEEMGQYRAIEAKQNDVLMTRQQFIMQLQENDMVKQELDRLGEDAGVFKLIGPVLIRQDLDEAKQNVSKRMDFIKGEIQKTEKIIEKNKQGMQEHGEKVIKMQGDLQAKAAAAARDVIKEAQEEEEVEQD
uniref:Prefoldin subunit 6 n=1 Tax=Rhizochromulina marina TaxID=1034831 RepID=A0A7S2WV68_9STRA|eukprot:CAMPEP_0118973460 /NCGR_PEP_ID=MMETSP1173-20130426/10157_1 /TAXON_ID=1034831 /ORGANISM="Rhizochromulina marina cf, Strain CCMP1243" /LENGTH=145 /DNA_ID=CAMNT_0006923119 /DNA_START=27 /DNA_END=464 /DNA_ORIENTATION=+